MNGVDDEVEVVLQVGSERFPALVGPERWNGFVVPRFRPDVARRVVAWNEATFAGDRESDHLEWFDTPTGGVVLVSYGDSHDEADIELVEADRDGRFAIGGYAWAWQLAEVAS